MSEQAYVFPASFAQQRLWFLDQLRPGRADYNVPTAVRLDGPLDEPRLRAALDALARRHDVLRTRYPLVDDEPAQLTGDAGPELEVADHRGDRVLVDDAEHHRLIALRVAHGGERVRQRVLGSAVA